MDARIESLDVRAFTIPTDAPEADGTIAWETLIREILHDDVVGRDAIDVPGVWGAMVASIRNVGRPGVASMAISAIDAALWDLKAKLLGLSVARLLGMAPDTAPV